MLVLARYLVLRWGTGGVHALLGDYEQKFDG